MKRTISLLIVMLMMVSQLVCPVLAEESFTPEVKVVSGYWDNRKLYTFAQFAQEDPTDLDTALLVSNAMIQKKHPETIQDAGMSIHYMLLVDASTSMESYRYKIKNLARELMNAQQNISVSVACFGSEVSVLASKLTQWNEVQNALNSISYQREISNIAGSVAAALEILGEAGYPADGEMTNLVVLTDGETWYSKDAQTEAEQELQANEAAKRMRAAYPEIVLHTFSFGVWNTEAEEILQDHRGLNGAVKNAAKLGQELAAYAESVYAIAFDLSGYDEDVIIPEEMVLSVGRSQSSYGRVRNVGSAPETVQPTDPTEETPVIDVPPTTAPVENPATEAGSAETTIPADSEVPAGTTAPSVPDSTEGSEPEKIADVDGSEYDCQEDPKPSKFSVWYFVATGGVLLLGVVLLVLWKGRIPKGAIRMRIDLIAGSNVRLKNMYYLDKELLIGSGKQCDIVLSGVAQDSVNARIFKQNQILYVEDIGLSTGILLNGMQIFSSNRLRSGDEITIGTVTLRVLF